MPIITTIITITIAIIAIIVACILIYILLNIVGKDSYNVKKKEREISTIAKKPSRESQEPLAPETREIAMNMSSDDYWNREWWSKKYETKEVLKNSLYSESHNEIQKAPSKKLSDDFWSKSHWARKKKH
uniref:Uncharacterized protein n=1 Tax=Ignisphaera aggregans TaxID=334771 RepID=A0A7C5YWC5_9CREN